MSNRTSGRPAALRLEHLEPRWTPAVDVFLEWNEVALDANVFDHNGPEVPGDQLSDTQGPPASARALGIVHAAMFDAYNSIAGQYAPYLVQAPNAAGASIDAAVARAGRDALFGLYDDPALRETIDQALETTLGRVPDGPAEELGVEVGRFVAAEILAARADDGSGDPRTYEPTGEPGNHDLDPLNLDQGFISPGYGVVDTFAVPDVTAFRGPEPPTLGSRVYADALEEVARLGGDGLTTATERTDDQTVIANYWSYNGSPGTGTPPRLYNLIAREVAGQEGNDLHENARLFTLLNLSMADAGISAWDTKYTFDYWRPILGIREADTDDNPATTPDPDWSPLGGSRSNPFEGELNFSPPFPAYTSGHATFGAAAFKTLANFYQTDDVSFAFFSDEWNGMTRDQFNDVREVIPRSFGSFSQAAAENAASRVFNGVHWRFDGTEGVRAGTGIANFTYENLLAPVSGSDPEAIPDSDFEGQIESYLEGDIPNGGDTFGVDVTVSVNSTTGDIEVLNNRNGGVVLTKPQEGEFVFIGTNGSDRIVLDVSGGAFTIPVRLDGGGGSDSLTVRGTGGEDSVEVGAEAITVNGLEIQYAEMAELAVTTLGGDDEIVVTGDVAAPLTVNAGAGADFISGGAGDELLIGGLGDDVILAGGGNDLVLGGFGDDFLVGGDGTDFVFGGFGRDVLIGGTLGGSVDVAGLVDVWSDEGLSFAEKIQALGDMDVENDGDVDWLIGGFGRDLFPRPFFGDIRL